MNDYVDELYRDLASLRAEAFPKRCAGCGRVYRDATEYLRETLPVKPGKSGLKGIADDTEGPLVELYRNCRCGSTLLEFFCDRRDTSEAGLRRRELFARILDNLVEAGADRGEARAELIKGLRGQPVDLRGLTKGPDDDDGA